MILECGVPDYPKVLTERALVWRMLKRLDGGRSGLSDMWGEFPGHWVVEEGCDDELHMIGLEDHEYWHLLQIRTDARMRHLDRAQRDGLLADCGSPEGLHAILNCELLPLSDGQDE